MAAYNPNEHLIQVRGNNYLSVQQRVLWLRDVFPCAIIETTLIEHDATVGFALYSARISVTKKDDDGNVQEYWATGSGSETRTDWKDYIEKAETKAVGRAAALLGFGTQFAQELAEGNIVDAPAPPAAAAAHTATVATTLVAMLARDEEGTRIFLARAKKSSVDDALAVTNLVDREKLLTWLRKRSQVQGEGNE